MTFSSDLVASGDVRPKARIFISYSRKDLAFVDRLDAALKARGFEPLIDRDQIYAFEPWWERIQALIMEADTIIFVLSPSAVLSETCAKEVSFAASLHKRFAPVVCERVEGSVPEPLRRLNYIFCDDNARFDASVDQLVDALSTDIDWFRKHTEFGTMARRWEAAGKPSPHGLLLRSPVLEEVENWIASRPPRAPEPTLTTREFISESRKQENALIAAARDARKRKRRLELALFGMLILTSVLGIVYALWTNFDYLKVRGEMLVDQFWSKILTVELEQRYAQSNLQPGEII